MAIYTLPYNSTKQLTKHINAQELKCKGTELHNITVNEELLNKVEKLMTILKAEHIYISSANRCKPHDVRVGGSGWGMHTIGKALDFKLNKGGKAIDTRAIAAVAQELGFTGIGRIKSVNNEYIHCDVGTIAEHGGKKWLGDETVPGGTSGSIITEPYTYWQYYRLNRSDYVDTPAETVEKQLQHILGVTVDGIIGPKTIQAIKNRPIKQGDAGEYVMSMQKLLNNKGYDCGAADGIAGAKTMQAIFNAAVDGMMR